LTRFFESFARPNLETTIRDNFDGFFQKYGLLIVDGAITGIGASVALSFKQLAKVGNSAYLAASLALAGWWVLLVDVAEIPIPSWIQFYIKVVLMVVLFFWHSLMISKKKVSDYERTMGKKKPKVAIKKALQKFKDFVIAIPAYVNKIAQGFSMVVGNAFNQKAEPRTIQQMVREACEQLGIQDPKTTITKFMIKEFAKRAVRAGLEPINEKGLQEMDTKLAVLKAKLKKVKDKKEKKKAEEDYKEAAKEKVAIQEKAVQQVELVGTICSNIDVASMRKVIYEVKDGSGDFTKVLGGLFDDVVRSLEADGASALGKLGKEELKKMWKQNRGMIKKKVAEKLHFWLSKVVCAQFKIIKKEEQLYIEGLFRKLDFDNLMQVYKLAKASWCFSFEDVLALVNITETEKAQQLAKRAAAKKAKKALPAEVEAKVIPSEGMEDAAAEVEIPEIKKELSSKEKSKEAQIEQIMKDPAIAEAVLQKAYDKSFGQLGAALVEVLSFAEGLKARIEDIPVVDELLETVVDFLKATEVKIMGLIKAALEPIPLGRQLYKCYPRMKKFIKRKTIQWSIQVPLKMAGVAPKTVADVLKKFGQMDEYLEDAMKVITRGASGSSKSPKGVMGLIEKQLQARGPGACKDMMEYAIVELFEVDLQLAKKFISKLSPKDILTVGQQIMYGGFPFDLCTDLVQNKVEQFDFLCPVKYLQSSPPIDEDEMTFDYADLRTPPEVAVINQEWLDEIEEETGQKMFPQVGDRLLSIEGNSAAEFNKELFDQCCERMCADAITAAGGADNVDEAEPVKMTFERGLNIDFAERFRDVLPMVLRKFLGLPVAQGREFARNLEMENMKRVVCLLLTGSLKGFDDLAQSMSVADTVNFEQSIKGHVPFVLNRQYGFSLRGADRFAAALDPGHECSLRPFLKMIWLKGFAVRIKQMLGWGDLETMTRVIARKRIHKLDHLHAVRYYPRKQLNKFLPEDPMAKSIQTNLVVTGFQKDGKEWKWKGGFSKGRDPGAMPADDKNDEEEPPQPGLALTKSLSSVADANDPLLAPKKEASFAQKMKANAAWPRSNLELWQNGEKVSRFADLHTDVFFVVLAIWEENVLEHANEENTETKRGANNKPLPQFSDPEVPNELVQVMQRNKYTTKEAMGEFYKYPDFIIRDAKLGEKDTKIANDLFYLALREARETVWEKYERKILMAATLCLCAPKGSLLEQSGDKNQKEVAAATDVTEADVAKALEAEMKIDEDIRAWFEELFAKLPPPGPKRTKPLLAIERAVEERDTYRLAKMADSYGVKTGFPYDGVLAQLTKDLSSLPDEVNVEFLKNNSDEFAEFCSNAANPLLGKHNARSIGEKENKKRAAAKSETETVKAAPAAQAATDFKVAPDAKVAEDAAAASLPGRVAEDAEVVKDAEAVPAKAGMMEEARHCAPPPDFSPDFSLPNAVEDGFDLEAGTRAPIQLQPDSCHTAALPAGSEKKFLKLKDLFIMAQKGDFEMLGKFAAAKLGGPKVVAASMRQKFVLRLKEGFLVTDELANQAAGKLQPPCHIVNADTKLAESKPTKDNPMEKNSKKRDGKELQKGKRVAILPGPKGEVDPTKKKKCVLVLRPFKGWLPEDELTPMSDAAMEKLQYKALDDISVYLRNVKTYDIDQLQIMSDELDMGIDFMDLARARIVKTIRNRTTQYSVPSLEKATKKVSKNGVLLGAVLQALDRNDIKFTVDALQLPPPEKRKKKPSAAESKVEEKAGFWQKEAQKLERQVTKLKDQSAEKDEEIETLEKQVVSFSNILISFLPKLSAEEATEAVNDILMQMQDDDPLTFEEGSSDELVWYSVDLLCRMAHILKRVLQENPEYMIKCLGAFRKGQCEEIEGLTEDAKIKMSQDRAEAVKTVLQGVLEEDTPNPSIKITCEGHGEIDEEGVKNGVYIQVELAEEGEEDAPTVGQSLPPPPEQ